MNLKSEIGDHTLHILYFPTRFFPAISGGDFYMQRIAEEIKRLKNKVTVYSTNAIDFAGINGTGKKVDRKHKNYSEYKNLKLTRLDTSSNEKMDSSNFDEIIRNISDKFNLPQSIISFFIKNGPILIDFINFLLSDEKEDTIIFDTFKTSLNQIDLIHTTYLPYANLLYTILIGLKYHIPCAVTPFLHYENIRYKNPEIFELLSYFDLIFACTEYEKNLMIENGINESKIKVLPMGVDLIKFQKNHRVSFEKLYNKPEKAIIFSGNKNYEKGALSILKTIPIIYPKIPELTFIMIGPSTSAYNYQFNQVRKSYPNVKIINISPDNLSGIFDPIKIGAFQYSLIYCMPSRSDAYGIAYLEGWSVKIPVIAAKIPAMEEIISDGINGRLVEFDNHEELAKSIIELLSNDAKRQEMGNNGYQKVLINNNWNEIAIKTSNYYKEMIDIKRSLR